MNRQWIVNSVLIGIFMAALTGVAVGMNYLRDAALQAYGTEKSQADWDDWREDVAKESKAFEDAAKGTGKKEDNLPPVKRRVSKAPEPPALLLMRDRYAVCMVAALLLSGAMIGSVLLLARGALLAASAPTDPHSNDKSPAA